MFDLLVALTASVLFVGTIAAYRRTNDALHAMLFLGPLFFYSCVIEPVLVRDDLHKFFNYEEDVEYVLLLNLAAVTALVFGASHRSRVATRARPTQTLSLSTTNRVMLQRIALVLAVIAFISYIDGLVNRGGFLAAYSQAKGGGYSSSGYVREALNLGLVAAAMVALSQHRHGLTVRALVILTLAIGPNLAQGTFGGRRGPLFLALTAALFVWVTTRAKRPRLWVMTALFSAVLICVGLIWSQRQHLHLGSEDAQIDWGGFNRFATLDEVNEDNNFVYGTGFVIVTRESGQYTWGRELAVNLFIRPIPRQLWETKYEDVGANWVNADYPGLGPFSMTDWLNTVGWIPPAGSSAVSISDLYGEFGWGAVIVLYVIGRGFAELRFRRQTLRGVWDLLYIEALMLCIYLATQSFSAFYHRFLILAIPTVVVWRMFMTPDRKAVGWQPPTNRSSFPGHSRARA